MFFDVEWNIRQDDGLYIEDLMRFGVNGIMEIADLLRRKTYMQLGCVDGATSNSWMEKWPLEM